MTEPAQGNDVTEVPRAKKSRTVKLVPIIVVAALVGLAFFVASRPTPGQRTTTDTSVKVVIGTSAGSEQAEFPIALQEGGDPAHESDHVIGPLESLDGVSTATLDWSSGVVLQVEFDPEVTSSEEIAGALAEAGYLEAPTGN